MSSSEQCRSKSTDRASLSDQSKSLQQIRLSKSLPQPSRHIANKAVNRNFGDAVADHRVHDFSERTKGWFVKPREIQLRFSASQWINREFRLHERKQAWYFRRLPLKLQPGNGA